MGTTNTLLVYGYWLLLGCIPTVAVLAFVFFVAMLLGGTHQGVRRRWFVFFALCFPMLIAGQYFYLQALQASMGREQQHQYDASRRLQDVATSVAQVGQKAPVFSVTTTTGNAFDLSQAQGKLVVLNFFATWCGPCCAELPHLNTLYEKYKGNEQVEFLVLGREETDQIVSDFQTKEGLSLPMAADPNRAIYAAYATESIPRTYLIDRDGKILRSMMGFYEPEMEELEAQLEKLLGP